MNADNYQSHNRDALRSGLWLSATALLLGILFIFAGLGGLEKCYFELKSAQEQTNRRLTLQEEQSRQAERQSRQEFSMLEQKYEALRDSAKTFEQSAASLQLSITKRNFPAHASPEPKTASGPVASASGSPSPSPTTAVSEPNQGWNLSETQRQKIVDGLRKQPGKTITICSVLSDSAGTAFAGTLKHQFEEAGWRVDGVKQISYAKPPVGLILASGSFPAPESLVATWRTFTSAGFHVSQQLDSKLTGGQVELLVGAAQ